MTKTTNYERVRKANMALIERGGRRMPSGYLQPDASDALDNLMQSGYAASAVGAISRALMDAAKKVENNSNNP